MIRSFDCTATAWSTLSCVETVADASRTYARRQAGVYRTLKMDAVAAFRGASEPLVVAGLDLYKVTHSELIGRVLAYRDKVKGLVDYTTLLREVIDMSRKKDSREEALSN